MGKGSQHPSSGPNNWGHLEDIPIIIPDQTEYLSESAISQLVHQGGGIGIETYGGSSQAFRWCRNPIKGDSVWLVGEECMIIISALLRHTHSVKTCL